jgi:hypothetical protein
MGVGHQHQEGFVRTLQLLIPALVVAKLGKAGGAYNIAPEPSILMLLAWATLIIPMILRSRRRDPKP